MGFTGNGDDEVCVLCQRTWLGSIRGCVGVYGGWWGLWEVRGFVGDDGVYGEWRWWSVKSSWTRRLEYLLRHNTWLGHRWEMCGSVGSLWGMNNKVGFWYLVVLAYIYIPLYHRDSWTKYRDISPDDSGSEDIWIVQIWGWIFVNKEDSFMKTHS